MGIRQTNFKKAQMKLFAVLALVVAARQVDKYDNDVEIGGPCTHDGDDCGLLAECNTEKKCACKDGFEQDGETNNCKLTLKPIGVDCDDATECGTNAVCEKPATAGYQAIRTDGKVCACDLDAFTENADKTNCDAIPPSALGETCTLSVGCGDNQECIADATDASKMTCKCIAGHTADDKVCIVDETTEDSAAFYSVATAFMALILA